MNCCCETHDIFGSFFSPSSSHLIKCESLFTQETEEIKRRDRRTVVFFSQYISVIKSHGIILNSYSKLMTHTVSCLVAPVTIHELLNRNQLFLLFLQCSPTLPAAGNGVGALSVHAAEIQRDERAWHLLLPWFLQLLNRKPASAQDKRKQEGKHRREMQSKVHRDACSPRGPWGTVEQRWGQWNDRGAEGEEWQLPGESGLWFSGFAQLVQRACV